MSKDTPKTFQEALIRIFWGKKWTSFFFVFCAIIMMFFFFYTTILTEKQRDNLWTSETKNDTTTQNGKKAAIPNSSFQSEEQKYWNSLSDEWKKALKGNAKLTTPIQKITKEELDKIYKLTFLNLKKYNVKDFKPFENSKFTNLKDIFHANTILSLEGIEKVEKLEFLNLENSKIISIKKIGNLKNLKKVNLSNTQIDSQEINQLKKINENVKVKS